MTVLPDKIYHTTSYHAAEQIQRTGILEPKNGFISFSAHPIMHGDISANDVILVFDALPLLPNLLQVKYTEKWYDKYPEHASYIAGEGWREQLDTTECYDFEDDWEDDDCVEAMTRDAELESFLFKSDEEEWISKVIDEPIRFRPEWLLDVVEI